MLNIWALHHFYHDWPWQKRNWGKLHFILIAVSLPSFSFTYWSGCFAKRSSLAVGCRGPALPFAGLAVFPFPSRTAPSRKQLLCASMPLSSACCCSAGAQQGQESSEKGQQRSWGGQTCARCCTGGGSAPQGSWLAAPPPSSLGKNSLSKRRDCLLWKMGAGDSSGQRCVCINNSSAWGNAVESPKALFCLRH